MINRIGLGFAVMLQCLAASEGGTAGGGTAGEPRIPEHYGDIPERFACYSVVLKPEVEREEWWAGAPSVVLDSLGTFWMACRMRTADAPRGLRGYELRLLRSRDGVIFETVRRIRREQVPIPGFERPALLFDPVSNAFKLYGCGPWNGGPWCVIKFDDFEDPAQFDPSTARPVIEPPEKSWEREIIVSEIKDPVIFYARDFYHAYVIGYLRRNERIYHYTSADGETWQPADEPNRSLLPLAGWHDFFVRPAGILPVGTGYLFFYEGSSTSWYDPVYNVVTGLAFTFDLHSLIDLTPDSPLLVSRTPGQFATWRYSHWMWVDGQIWVYAEVATPKGTHEIRLYRIAPENLGRQHWRRF